VITGVSGSGKSSLAFDTLYAEGRRRYVECLSTYLQQFLDRMARPELDGAEGLPPAVALERAVPAAQARSTVGTTTEISDYLRLLFARVGIPSCPSCGRDVLRESPSNVAEVVTTEGGQAIVTFVSNAPRAELEREGFHRFLEDEVVVDRLTLTPERRARVAEAVETAYRFGHDRVTFRWPDGRVRRFSARLHCPDCDIEIRAPEPRSLSPNSPLGACPDCQGFGRSVQFDLDRVVPDRGRTLRDGAVDPWNKPAYREAYTELRSAGRAVDLPWNVPYGQLSDEHRRLIEEGGHGFYGIRGFFEWLEGRTYKVHVRVFLARYRAYRPCPSCGGMKLRPEALAVRIAGENLGRLGLRPIEEVHSWLGGLDLPAQAREIAAPVLRELDRRLGYLVEVGLGYLTLERPSRTLSGGESQRIQLARAVGSGLVDTLYVLDEPSVGLHPLDVDKLLGVLEGLRNLGNTVVVVEHDPRVMRRSDWLIDLGPGAGSAGGHVLYQGPPSDLPPDLSPTARYLATGPRSPIPRRPVRDHEFLMLEGASTHNLRDVTVRIPRRALTVVTGVSGSGKSSLIHDTLHGALSAAVGGRRIETGPYRSLSGTAGLTGVELVDQSPIGRSPRSNPVTYVEAFTPIRKRLAVTAEARARRLKPGYFSFNVRGGRCETCEGAGSIVVEMHFLPDILIPCESCHGSRFGPGALAVRDRGRTVAQILELTVDDAIAAYADVPDIVRPLRPLAEVGLGYLRLGQPAPTLSGGEAQRLKLAAHLAEREGSRVFLLDEPTTGLHPQDVEVLLRALDRLVEAGHTVVVVEHNLDLVRAADWVIDLGPGAGPEGGRLVAQGPPSEVAGSTSWGQVSGSGLGVRPRDLTPRPDPET
jgi:excinuclease ABC subunit A